MKMEVMKNDSMDFIMDMVRMVHMILGGYQMEKTLRTIRVE